MRGASRRSSSRTALLLCVLLLPLLTACSLRQLAVKQVAATFAQSGEVYASDDDPELVGEALPFALKTMESLLAETPENRDLLRSVCEGFTGYAYAYVELEAERIAPREYERASRLRDRALKLYLRARGYCFRALELRFPGVVERLRQTPQPEVLAAAARRDVPLLYWSGASWGAAIGAGLDRPELVVDLPAVQAILERALELDPDYRRGALHEAMIAAEAVPEMMGGSYDRAREHFRRAVELSGGTRAIPYVTLAVKVAVPEQDREEFERLLQEALAVDPDAVEGERLANLINQRRARWLLERADELFLEPLDDGARDSPEDDFP